MDRVRSSGKEHYCELDTWSDNAPYLWLLFSLSPSRSPLFLSLRRNLNKKSTRIWRRPENDGPKDHTIMHNVWAENRIDRNSPPYTFTSTSRNLTCIPRLTSLQHPIYIHVDTHTHVCVCVRWMTMREIEFSQIYIFFYPELLGLIIKCTSVKTDITSFRLANRELSGSAPLQG